MIFKYKDREMEVPDDFIMKCGQHAEERGMTLEEYIAEAFTRLKESEEPKEESCGGVPKGWISEETWQENE
jgi:dTDP-4-dehydrorhamnose 3,5-epimerase-like enzyme